MLNCRSVWDFECLVSILYIKLLIHFSLQQTYQKMDQNYLMFLYQALYVPSKWWRCTTHDVSGPNHGAGPHQYVELHSEYHHFPYGLLKTKKTLKTIPKNLEKPSKSKEKLKDLFSGSLGQDMSAARVAENSRGDRRCLDEICARRNTYMCW